MRNPARTPDTDRRRVMHLFLSLAVEWCPAAFKVRGTFLDLLCGSTFWCTVAERGSAGDRRADTLSF
jgi:hypothetical protein